MRMALFLKYCFSFGTPLPQAVPSQRPRSSLSEQDEASRGAIGFADAPKARPLTPHLAPKQLLNGFTASEVRPEAVPSDLAKAQHNRSKELLDLWCIPVGTHPTAQSALLAVA